MTRWREYWPLIAMISAASVAFVTFTGVAEPLRPAVSLWFLLVCPGMTLVRTLRIQDDVAEWTLAIALSLALDLVTASIVLYSGSWSPQWCLAGLIFVTLAIAMLQLFTSRSHKLSEERSA